MEIVIFQTNCLSCFNRNVKRGLLLWEQSSESFGRLSFLLAEVAFQQAFESLSMAGFVAGHFMHGVMDGVEVQLLGLQSQLELAGGGAVARHENRLFAALRAAKRLIFFASRGDEHSFP